MDHLNMSLDDIIKTSKKPASGNSRGGHPASGAGPARRLPNRAGNRATPYGGTKAPVSTWQHDLYAVQGTAYYGGAAAPAGRSAGIETGTKLYISNLDYGVSNEDIKELFAEVGELKRYGVHYDRSGRSKGTADVVFSRRQDAMAALKRYHTVMLDGKPMNIEIVGSNISAPVAPVHLPPVLNGAFRNINGAPRGGQSRGGAFNRPRGGGGRGFGRGRGGSGGRGRGGRTGEKPVKVSAEDLDAELEKYHKTAESMQE